MDNTVVEAAELCVPQIVGFAVVDVTTGAREVVVVVVVVLVVEGAVAPVVVVVPLFGAVVGLAVVVDVGAPVVVVVVITDGKVLGIVGVGVAGVTIGPFMASLMVLIRIKGTP